MSQQIRSLMLIIFLLGVSVFPSQIALASDNGLTADPQEIDTEMDISVDIILTGSDINESDLNYVIQDYPTHGELSGEAPDVIYTPDDSYIGDDAFTFYVSDGTNNSDPATVTIHVLSDDPSDNNPPEAFDQELETDQGQYADMTLDATDSDGDEISYQIITQPTGGTLYGDLPEISYIPRGGFSGTDTFTFSANDGYADSNTATITITVNAVDEDYPINLKPKNGAILGRGANKVTLSWSKPRNMEEPAVGYMVEVSTTPLFTDTVFSTGDPITKSRWTITNLPLGQTYYWRVAALFGEDIESGTPGNWSSCGFDRSFKTQFLSAPKLGSPKNNAKTKNNTKFTWTKPSGAPRGTRYVLAYSTSPDFEDENTTYLDSTNRTSTRLTDLDAGTYYWKVQAVYNEEAISGWSTVRSFHR